MSKKTHGLHDSLTYRNWLAMKVRCLNKNHISFTNHGGRGITICDRWKYSFENFHADMGSRPTKKHTLDRIDNDGNYEPSNCRWATRSEQLRNTRRSVYLEVDGIKKLRIEWCEIYGISENLVRIRLRRGWEIKKALTQKPGKRSLKMTQLFKA